MGLDFGIQSLYCSNKRSFLIIHSHTRLAKFIEIHRNSLNIQMAAIFTVAQLQLISVYEDWTVLGCQCLSVGLSVSLLSAASFGCPRPIRMAPIMRLFLSLHTICTLSSMVASVQKVKLEYLILGIIFK
jgi:hypothetical protein